MQELGHELLVGNPTQIRAPARSRHKSDRRDADSIPDLLLKDEFPALWRRSVKSQTVLEQLRFHHALVKQRTQICNRLQALAHSAGLPKRSMRTRRARESLMEARFSETQSFQRDQLFELLDNLTERIKVIECWLEEKAADSKVQPLLTHKGIGLLSVIAVVHIRSAKPGARCSGICSHKQCTWLFVTTANFACFIKDWRRGVRSRSR